LAKVKSGAYADSEHLSTEALTVNLLQVAANVIDGTNLVDQDVISCAIDNTVPLLQNISLVLANATSFEGVISASGTLLGDLVEQTASCAQQSAVKSIFETLGKIIPWVSTLNDVLSTVSNAGLAAQRLYELNNSASAVETAVISIGPGSGPVIPSISSLVPASATVGTSSQILTINGTNFISGSTVTFKGTQHQASFVNSGQLTIMLSATDLAAAGSFPVVVTNPSPGGGESNTINFVVANQPLPTLQSLVVNTGGTGSLIGGTSTTGTVSLNNIAPAGGVQVNLSSNSSYVQVPSTVNIAAGQTSATLTITTTAVTSMQSVIITASLGTQSLMTGFEVTPGGGGGGISLQGRSFGINGTIIMNGNALSFEIQALAESDTQDFIEFDDGFSIGSWPQFTEEFYSGINASGSTVVFGGPTTIGDYLDINLDSGMPIRITSTSLTITFTTLTVGSTVTGSASFTTSAGTFQGTITGSIVFLVII
jgi:hypothetical protein